MPEDKCPATFLVALSYLWAPIRGAGLEVKEPTCRRKLDEFLRVNCGCSSLHSLSTIPVGQGVLQYLRRYVVVALTDRMFECLGHDVVAVARSKQEVLDSSSRRNVHASPWCTSLLLAKSQNRQSKVC